MVAWCYAHGVAVVPRGGGTGYAGGAVPLDGGVVLSLERLDRVRSFDPLLWRIEVEAGMRTAEVRRVAREGGLLFAPDPGAAEQSQIGGNIATNAGGPHAYKYGVTGKWVTGLEVVVPPGELVRFGGPLRKDVAGYDLKQLLIGSEGTLGVITAVVASPDTRARGGVARDRLLRRRARRRCRDRARRRVGLAGRGARVPRLGDDALRRCDVPRRRAGRRVRGARRGGRVARRGCARSRGSARGPRRGRARVVRARDAGGDRGAVALARRARARRRRTDGAARRARTSPCRSTALARRSRRRSRSGRRFGIPAASWGHAGDGNLHTTFLLAGDDERELALAPQLSEALFEIALRLGGTISGEHGVGSSSATGSSASSGRAHSSCTRRSSTRSTRRTCSTPGRRRDRGDPAGLEALGSSAPGVRSRGGRPGRVVHRCRVRPVRSRDDTRVHRPTRPGRALACARRRGEAKRQAGRRPDDDLLPRADSRRGRSTLRRETRGRRAGSSRVFHGAR